MNFLPDKKQFNIQGNIEKKLLKLSGKSPEEFYAQLKPFRIYSQEEIAKLISTHTFDIYAAHPTIGVRCHASKNNSACVIIERGLIGEEVTRLLQETISQTRDDPEIARVTEEIFLELKTEMQLEHFLLTLIALSGGKAPTENYYMCDGDRKPRLLIKRKVGEEEMGKKPLEQRGFSYLHTDPEYCVRVSFLEYMMSIVDVQPAKNINTQLFIYDDQAMRFVTFDPSTELTDQTEKSFALFLDAIGDDVIESPILDEGDIRAALAKTAFFLTRNREKIFATLEVIEIPAVRAVMNERLENLYREIGDIDIARFEISADLKKYAARRLDPGIGDLAEAVAAVSEASRIPISAQVARSETIISRDCKISSQLPRVAAKSPMFAD